MSFQGIWVLFCSIGKQWRFFLRRGMMWSGLVLYLHSPLVTISNPVALAKSIYTGSSWIFPVLTSSMNSRWVYQLLTQNLHLEVFKFTISKSYFPPHPTLSVNGITSHTRAWAPNLGSSCHLCVLSTPHLTLKQVMSGILPEDFTNPGISHHFCCYSQAQTITSRPKASQLVLLRSNFGCSQFTLQNKLLKIIHSSPLNEILQNWIL